MTTARFQVVLAACSAYVPGAMRADRSASNRLGPTGLVQHRVSMGDRHGTAPRLPQVTEELGGRMQLIDRFPAKYVTTTAPVASQNTSYSTRFQSVSNGLRAAQVASAASTLLAGAALADADRRALTEVTSNLRNEAAALTDPSSGQFGNEASFAFAGFALSSLPRSSRLPYSPDKAASALQKLAEKLEKMLGDDPPTKDELETFEELFLNVSNEIGRTLSRTGETVDGIRISV